MLHSIQTAYSRISLELEPPAAILTLVHPPLNVIDLAMMNDLAAALEHVRSRADLSILLLSGVDEHFSAGVDIKAHTPEKAGDMLKRFHGVIRALASLPLVTVASVRGECLGGGAELALICDLAFCTEDSRWGFPEINLGCYPPVAAALLGQIVGQKRAAELVLTGNIIHGEQAFTMGMVNDAVPDDELDDLVEEVTQRLAALSPMALALTKKALCSSEFEAALARSESIYLNELIHTADAREGIQAWLEKREPRWTGK